MRASFAGFFRFSLISLPKLSALGNRYPYDPNHFSEAILLNCSNGIGSTITIKTTGQRLVDLNSEDVTILSPNCRHSSQLNFLHSFSSILGYEEDDDGDD